MSHSPLTVWDLIDEGPEYAKRTCDLYAWSINWEPGTGPFLLFLDLVGYSSSAFGEAVYPHERIDALGYVELAKLGRALDEYAQAPHEVEQWVGQLLQAEACHGV
jgi:hypothetical protein